MYIMSEVASQARYHLADRMRDLYRAAVVELQRELAAAGCELNPSEINLLGRVPSQGCRVLDLVDRVQLSEQAVSKMVGQLEQRGLLERSHDPTDGRAVLVRHTAAAEAGYRVARRTLDAIEARWRVQLGDERFEHFDEALRR